MTMAVVEKARSWADHLIWRETRGPGDFGPALQRVARRLGLSESALKALRYKQPKDITASLFETLRTAYEAEVRKQEQRFEHELRVARAAGGGVDSACVRAAVAVAGFDPAASAGERAEER